MALCLWPLHALAAPLVLDKTERAWLQAHPTVLLCLSDLSPPLMQQDEQGNPVGYLPDLYQMLGARLGITFSFKLSAWSKAVSNAKENRCDGLAQARRFDSWHSHFLLSNTILPLYDYLYVPSASGTPIRSLKDLAGKRVGYTRDALSQLSLLKKYPNITGVPIDTIVEQIEALSSGKIDALISSIGVEFQRRQLRKSTIKLALQIPETRIDGVIAVRKDWPELHALLNKALASMSPLEKRTLEERWYFDVTSSLQDSAKRDDIPLSEAEQRWLNAGHTVRVRVSNFPPYLHTRPQPSGLAIDYLEASAKRFGFQLELIATEMPWSEAWADVIGPRKHFDLLATLNPSPEREAVVALTKPYASSPYVLYTRSDSPLLGGLDSLAGKTVAAEKGYVSTQRLIESYPKINYLEVTTPLDALRAVATGRADAYVGDLAMATYQIKEHRLTNLMVSAPTPFADFTSVMAVRKDWPELASLINKGIAGMAQDERAAIANKWGSVDITPPSDYAMLLWVLAASATILLGVLYWNRRLRQERSRVQHYLELAETAQAQAEAANRAKSSFLADVSHELRTPLNAVIGITDLMQRRHTDPSLRESLGMLGLASGQLFQVINNVLDLSKIEAAQLRLEITEFRLTQVVDNVSSMIAPRIDEKGLQFSRTIAPQVATTQLRGDPLRLGQVLLNLLSNAIKFTAQGRIELRVSVVNETPDTFMLRWEIEDTGVGIAPEAQQRIFSSFEQAESSTARRFGGSGLGLAICKRLVNLMQGEIGVDSDVGKGSTFWFTTLLRRGPDEEASDRLSSTNPGAEEIEARLRSRHAGRRVLVVDDEAFSREFFSTVLDSGGLMVDVAADGAEALRLTRQHPYALILMDIYMPVMNGLDATRLIRSDSLNSETSLLAVTARVFDDACQAALNAGMNDHVPKPVSREILLATVLKWLDMRKA